MRIVAIPLLALTTLTGCMTVRANIPEEAVRWHLAKEEGIQLAAMCTYAGENYSQGGSVCMTNRRMVCNAEERWVQDGDC